jgi:hypothetical protein
MNTLTEAIRSTIDAFDKERQEVARQELQGQTLRISDLFTTEALEGARETLAANPVLTEAQPAEELIPRLSNGFAALMVEAVEGLVADSSRMKFGAIWAQVLGRTTDPYRPSRDATEVLLARRLVPDVGEAADRCFRLGSYVIHHPPSEPVRKYLARLSRCYLAGYDAECVMLCRAVLENAVNERFQRSGTTAPESMRQRLDKAVTSGWMSDKERGDAWTVWIRGNKVIHSDPELVRDVLGTIELTLAIAGTLYSDVTAS